MTRSRRSCWLTGSWSSKTDTSSRKAHPPTCPPARYGVCRQAGRLEPVRRPRRRPGGDAHRRRAPRHPRPGPARRRARRAPPVGGGRQQSAAPGQQRPQRVARAGRRRLRCWPTASGSTSQAAVRPSGRIPAAVAELWLGLGGQVWLSVKATDLEVTPATAASQSILPSSRPRPRPRPPGGCRSSGRCRCPGGMQPCDGI